MKVSVAEAKNTLPKLIKAVEDGESVTIYRHGTPVVDIVRVRTARPPVVSSFPIHTLNAIVALVLGFAAACYVALLLSYIDRLKLERIRRNLVEEGVHRELQP